MPEYYEWDFGRRIVTCWKRIGECNKCGACCKAKISYTFGGNGVGLWGQMGKTTADEQGVWLEVRQGNLRLFMGHTKVDQTDTSHACPLLVKGGCKAHKQKGKKAPLCNLWPIHPHQVEVFSECSYRFEKISEEKF